MKCEHGQEVCYLTHKEHDCLSREHDPDSWCPDCFHKEAAR